MMAVAGLIRSFCLMASLVIVVHAHADIEKIYILKESDDDHIIIVTEAGEKLLLENGACGFHLYRLKENISSPKSNLHGLLSILMIERALNGPSRNI